ncbi:MAG: hypothetical protein P1U65_18515 [Minwuia sp.]|nr:hypothetical protein [Minwuia sp.]
MSPRDFACDGASTASLMVPSTVPSASVVSSALGRASWDGMGRMAKSAAAGILRVSPAGMYAVAVQAVDPRASMRISSLLPAPGVPTTSIVSPS